MSLAVMDTHIRWKVKRRIRDAQITLAVILLFVTSQASSGKMQQGDLWILFGAALRSKLFFCLAVVDHCGPPPAKKKKNFSILLIVNLMYSSCCA